MKQLPKIINVQFMCGDYLNNEYSNIKESVIYCDPPYNGTINYKIGLFNHEIFWDWCRKMSINNKIFISEYHAPYDFECIWSKEHLVNFDCNRDNDKNKKIRIEKLFTYKP